MNGERFGLPPQITAFWPAETARENGGRALRNVLSETEPTGNLLPDYITFTDAAGLGVPPRSLSPTTISDPLAGHNAVLVNWGVGQPISHLVRTNAPAGLPPKSYTSTVWAKLAGSGPGTLAIGAASAVAGQFKTQPLTGEWQPLTYTNIDYAPSAKPFNLGIRNPGAAVDVALFGRTLYPADETPPDMATEFAAAAGCHMKPTDLSTITLDAEGWVVGGRNLIACPMQMVSSMILGGIVDIDEPPAVGYANLLAVTGHSGGQSNTSGAIGVSANGRIYGWPGLSTSVSTSVSHFTMQGGAVVFIDAGVTETTMYVNGVPVVVAKTKFTPFLLERLTACAYDGSKKFTQKSNTINRACDWIFGTGPFTQDDATQTHLALREHAETNGRILGPLSIAVIFCGDSLTRFPDSPPWPLTEDATLRGMWGYMEAMGGTFMGTDSDNYADPSRVAWRRRLICASLANGFKEVHVQWAPGNNDIIAKTRPMGTMAKQEAGRNSIWDMIMADKAACDDGSGRLKTTLVTVKPVASFSTEAKAIVELYNDYARANYRARGFDYLIDLAATPPAGHTSWLSCGEDALAKGGNEILLRDTIHYQTNGGREVAKNTFKPHYLACLAALAL